MCYRTFSTFEFIDEKPEVRVLQSSCEYTMM